MENSIQPGREDGKRNARLFDPCKDIFEIFASLLVFVNDEVNPMPFKSISEMTHEAVTQLLSSVVEEHLMGLSRRDDRHRMISRTQELKYLTLLKLLRIL